MDEPFSGIDVFAREDILEVFTSKFVTDKGVLIATHHMDEVEMLLDRSSCCAAGVSSKIFTQKTSVKTKARQSLM